MSNAKCLQDLPKKVLETIFGFLTLEDRKLASQVCRQWELLAFSPGMLKRVLLELRFDSREKVLEYSRVLGNSNRKYRHISVEFYIDSKETFLGIIEKFQFSLSSLRIGAYYSDDFEVSVDYLIKLFSFLSGLEVLRIFTTVKVSDDTGKEVNIEDKIQLPVLPSLKTLFLREDSLELTCFDWREIAPNLDKLCVAQTYKNSKIFYDLLSFYSSRLCDLGVSTLYAEEFYDGLGEISFPKVRKLTIVCPRIPNFVEWSSSKPSFTRFKRFLQRFTNLTELNYGHELTAEGLSYIVRRFPTLRTFRLDGDVPAELFPLLSELPQLQHITLVQSNLQVQALATSNPLAKVTEFNLKHFDFNEHVDHTEPFYQHLASKMPQLASFGIAHADESAFLPFIWDNLRNLTELKIFVDEFAVEKDSFSKLNQLEKLTDLWLSCDCWLSETFWQMFPVCPSIRRLQIQVLELTEFADAAEEEREWQHLAKNFPSLVSLRIGCNNSQPLTERQLNLLKTLMPRCAIEMQSRMVLFSTGADDGYQQMDMIVSGM